MGSYTDAVRGGAENSVW